MFDFILAFLSALLMTVIAMPWMIQLAHEWQWFDRPIARSSHNSNTPSSGGIVIFFSVLLGSLAWIPREDLGSLQFVLVAAVIIAITGMRDDLSPLNAWQKLSGEFIATTVLVFAADIRFISLHGLFGLETLPYFWSVVLSLFIIVMIINGFNLIDGIDGLSGTIGCIISITLAVWFFLTGNYALAILAIVLAGSLIGFLYFNYSPSKIFMGDTGSLLCGLLVAVLIIQFVNAHIGLHSVYAFQAVPIIALALLILPIVDSLRVFIIRISEGRSPLDPDRLHIHHLLIDCGFSHTKATLLLSGTTLFVATGTIQLQWIGSNHLFIILSIFALLFVTALQVYRLSGEFKRRLL